MLLIVEPVEILVPCTLVAGTVFLFSPFETVPLTTGFPVTPSVIFVFGRTEDTVVFGVEGAVVIPTVLGIFFLVTTPPPELFALGPE